jgi:hypothetical protein
MTDPSPKTRKIFMIIPAASYWLEQYVKFHGEENLYDINLGFTIVGLVSYWFLGPFLYMYYGVPFFHNNIHAVNEIDLPHNEPHPIISKLTNLWGRCKQMRNGAVYNFFSAQNFVKKVMKYWIKLHHYLSGENLDIVSLLCMLTVSYWTGNAVMDMVRTTFGLENTIPGPDPWYEFLHKLLDVLKTLGILCGPTHALGKFYIPHVCEGEGGCMMSNILPNLGTAVLVIAFVKSWAIMSLFISAITCKVFKATTFVLGYFVDDVRHPAIKTFVKGFQKMLFTRYNIENGYFKHIWENKTPIGSKTFITFCTW